jgi:MoaE-MoaD fusion protein
MTLRVRLFAMLRERAGWRERTVEVRDGALVEDAWAAAVALADELAPFRPYVRFAINGVQAGPESRLADGDELAIMPPVAGGAERAGVRLELTADPITDDLLAELRRGVATAADGAVVLFVGQTRETAGPPSPGEEEAAERHAGEQVSALDYEAFEEMALAVLREICGEAEQRFGVTRLAIVHRTGRVPLSEPSVVICAAAPHRGEAFDACRYAIEELKRRAPIWKRERYRDGDDGVWVSAEGAER